MSYPFGVRQESHPTFLHPDGLPVIGNDYVTRTGLELPSVATSRFELSALYVYVKCHTSSPEQPLPTTEQLDKITINEISGCWELPIYRDGNDVYPPRTRNAGAPRARYGRLAIPGVAGTSALAHRVMFTVMRGEIEKGKKLDHLCENKKCCWHRHLDPVTHADNTRRIHHADKLSKGQGLLDFE